MSDFVKHFNLNLSNRFQPLAGYAEDDSVFLDKVESPTDHLHANIASSPNTRATPKSGTSTDDPSTHSSTMPSRSDNIRIVRLNANSLKGKRAEIAELADTTQMDIMIISETNLHSNGEIATNPKTYCPQEVIPKNFNRNIPKPRSLHGGGVMIS